MINTEPFGVIVEMKTGGSGGAGVRTEYEYRKEVQEKLERVLDLGVKQSVIAQRLSEITGEKFSRQRLGRFKDAGTLGQSYVRQLDILLDSYLPIEPQPIPVAEGVISPDEAKDGLDLLRIHLGNLSALIQSSEITLPPAARLEMIKAGLRYLIDKLIPQVEVEIEEAEPGKENSVSDKKGKKK